jgi:Holliday junction DNA helicase RuvB
MMSVNEKEHMLRFLAGNPNARMILEKALQLEDEATEKEKHGELKYPWPGFQWHDIPAQTQTLNLLVVEGILVTGGLRGTYKTNSSMTFKLKNPDLVRECLAELVETNQETEEDEIPDDLFDFIIGQDEIKSILWRSLRSEEPVHVMLVGPPASSKSMFLGELARLPLSRFTLGGGTSKAGLTDFLLQFRPRYLIIDEIDKMDRGDMSILLSLMEGGTVTRLMKRMRETEQMKTWVFASANREDRIWPELKSRFFIIRLKEYSENDFINIARSVLISREKVDKDMAERIASTLAKYTRDVREAIHFGRLAKTPSELNDLLKLRWPKHDTNQT